MWEAAHAQRYVEPFVGSAALFFAAAPERAVLSDLNEELICTYSEIRDDPDGIADALDALTRRKDTYLRLRRTEPRGLTYQARAARFLYLNRYCFNGLYRTNSSGAFNVPYAPLRSGTTPSRERLHEVASLLRRADLHVGDYESVLVRVLRPFDFVYLDPPYAVANRRIFKQYDATTFGIADLDRLAHLLYAIDALGASFVLSYADCTEARSAFRDWPHIRVAAQRNIAGFSADRRRSYELLVTNLAESEAIA